MTTRQSPRAYSYHFLNSQSKNERPFSSHYENGDFPAKDRNYIYKFFGEFQENGAKNRNPETDLSKFALLKAKVVNPIKKYTFSGLTKFAKDSRKTEDTELYSQTASASKAPTDIERLTEGSQSHKKSIENEQELLNESYGKVDLLKQRSAENNIEINISKFEEFQEKTRQLSLENELLRVRVEEYKKMNEQLEKTEHRLNNELSSAYQTIGRQLEEIASLTKSEEKNKTEITELLAKIDSIQKSKPTLKIVREVVGEGILLQKPQKKQEESCSMPQQNEEKSYLQEYTQIANIFGFQISQDNCHRMLLACIEEAQKNIEEVHQHRGKLQHFDKQKNKMIHTLKKHEAEISKLCQENQFLTQELNKNVHLVLEYNEQIALLHLKNFESKLSSRFLEEAI